MGLIQDYAQKFKGKAQQVKGHIQQRSGKGFKGGMSKIEGKINEGIADAKLKMRARRYYEEGDDNAL